MADLNHCLKFAVEHQASDILIVAGGPVSAKIDGHLRAVDEERVLPPQTEALIRQIYEAAKRPMNALLEKGDDDFSFAIPGLARFRVNAGLLSSFGHRVSPRASPPSRLRSSGFGSSHSRGIRSV